MTRTTLAKTLVASMLGFGLLLSSGGQPAQAQGPTCEKGCEICGCYRVHPISELCSVPALEPCDCGICLDET